MSDPALLDAPAAPPDGPPAPPPDGPLADLILVRLLAAGEAAPKVQVVRRNVGSLFPHPPSEERFGDAVRSLRAAGLLAAARGLRLTPAGRERAMAYLGAADLPARRTWQTLVNRYLVPKALGLALGSAEAEQLVETKTFVPRLLKRELGLPTGTGNTLNAVVEALACRALGFEQFATMDQVAKSAFGKAVKADEPLTKKQAEKLAAPKLLGAAGGGPGAARLAVAGRLIVGRRSDAAHAPAAPEPAREPFDLEAFAHTVRAAARTSPTGRFGDNKVFIRHVWRQLHDHPQVGPLGADGFKAKLLEANRARLLTLSRADLVQMMDPADVRESEAGHGTDVSHFVLIGEA